MGKAKPNYDARIDCIDVKTLPSGDDAGVMQFYSGFALVTDFTKEGFDRFWLYPEKETALKALTSWDGQGVPPGEFSASIDRREAITS